MSTQASTARPSWRAGADRQRAAWRVSDRFVPAKHGAAELSLYVASKMDALRGAIHGENVEEGHRVMRLLVNGQLWMSDSPDEYRDHITAIRMATGRVLIHGLGLGCYLSAILTKPEVSHVDVVEKSADVLALVGPYFRDDKRVRLIEGDAFTQKWPRGTTWDCAWHDIWADKCSDDLAEHANLQRSFARRATWQGCWGHEWLLYQRERGR